MLDPKSPRFRLLLKVVKHECRRGYTTGWRYKQQCSPERFAHYCDGRRRYA